MTNTDNQKITFQGNPVSVRGKNLAVGESLPEYQLTGTDMQDVKSSDSVGRVQVICSVPSLDTPVCAIETKKFNDMAKQFGDQVQILVVSRDLPMAQKRWCGSEGVENVLPVSDYKYRSFGESYGVDLPDLGLLARAIFVADTNGNITHLEYVDEIANEPDYDSVTSAVEAALQ